MNAVADDYEEVVNNSGDLGKVESTSNVTLEEEEEFFDALEEQDWSTNINILRESARIPKEQEECFDSVAAGFDVPLSIFHYKDYNSDFFTSWYNISSRIFKEINQACPEKQALNLALSVLVFPYIVFTALGLAVYNKLKTNDKTQISSEENKTKKVSESTTKRLAYGVLSAVAILVSIPILLLLLIPAIPALAIFYLLNRKLSHFLIDVLKVSSGSYQKKHQNIEVSFREIDAGKSDIKWDMEVKFPPQFKQLLRDLYEDPEHNAVLKLSANIHLKNGLKPLRNEIKNVLATSIQEFVKAMEELMKLEKKDITYDKLKELLNEFRVEVVNSIGPKLTSHLIYNTYQVAFIQAIKFAQERKGDFLEDVLRDILVKQELESQGKELPSEKEIIIKDLKELKRKEVLDLADEDDRLEAFAKIGNMTSNIDDNVLLLFRAKWKQLIKERKIAEKTIIDAYRDIYPQATKEALGDAEEKIKHLKEKGQERYNKICEELKEMYNKKNGSLIDGKLKKKLEDLFKFEYDDQEVEKRLIKSVMKKAKGELSQSGVLDKERLNLIKQLEDLKKEIKIPLSEENLKEASDKVNDFIAKMYLEITKCKTQSVFKGQAKGIEDSCELLKKKAPDLVKEINSHRMRIEKYLERPEQPILLRKIIKGNKNLNKYLKDEQDSKGEKSPNTKLIEKHLENNQEILKALEQLESEKKGLLIDEETKNDYKEELTSREKIKFAIIEDDSLKAFEHEIFDEEVIKTLLEEVELEYYLAEKRIKSPVIKTKDNIKHFSQNLLSPLIDNLVKNIINNVPKSGKGPFLQPMKSFGTAWGYVKTGLVTAIYGNRSIEGKALEKLHDTYNEVGTFLEHFESSYEKAGAFLGNVFSDEGETFKNDVWPKIEEHLYGMWDRFFKDIEFKVGSRLDEVSLAQPKQETMIVAQ